MSSNTSSYPRIHTHGYRVFVPTTRMANGEWSSVEKIVAMFLDESEAEVYADYRRGVDGEPVRIEPPRVENGG